MASFHATRSARRDRHCVAIAVARRSRRGLKRLGPERGLRWDRWLSRARRRRRALEPRRDVDRDHGQQDRDQPATLTSGTWLASRKLWKIQIGSVLTPPASEDRDDDLVERQREREQRRRRAAPTAWPGTSRTGTSGSVSAPRSADASSSEPRRPPQPGDRVVVDEDDAERGVADDDRRRSRAGGRTCANVVDRAMPVTMPGRAIGRMTTNEIVSRPKNE